MTPRLRTQAIGLLALTLPLVACAQAPAPVAQTQPAPAAAARAPAQPLVSGLPDFTNLVEQVGPDDQDVFSKGMVALLLGNHPPATGADGFVAMAVLPQAVEVGLCIRDGVTLDAIMAEALGS